MYKETIIKDDCISSPWVEIFRSACHNSRKVTLTFWRCARHCRLVSMATVTGDERPTSAPTEGVLIPTATQSLVVEEAGARAKLGVLQRGADVPVNNS